MILLNFSIVLSASAEILSSGLMFYIQLTIPEPFLSSLITSPSITSQVSFHTAEHSICIWNIIYFALKGKSLLVRWCSTITIKSLYMMTCVCRNFGIRDVRGQIPKSIYQASNLLPIDFFIIIFPNLALIYIE